MLILTQDRGGQHSTRTVHDMADSDELADTIGFLVDLIHPPLDDLEAEASEDEELEDGHRQMDAQIEEQRISYESQLRLMWEIGEVNPLLYQIRQTRDELDQAEEHLRRMLAFAREFATPQHYRDDELAAAALIPPEELHNSYGEDDIEVITEITGLAPCPAEPIPDTKILTFPTVKSD